MEKNNEKISKKKNLFNISNKTLNSKKEDLCKKFFYKLNLDPKQKNIFHDMENGQNLDELEQVYNEHLIFQNSKNKLLKQKTEILKSMILHHKNIPERWIINYNYKSLLNKVMEDPIVLSYAIASKEIYKKRSTAFSIDIDDIKNNYNLSPEPKFISYINPYSRNFDESIQKYKIRKEYGYNIKNRKNKEQNIYTLQTECNTGNKLKQKLYLNTDNSKNSQKKELPNIFSNIKLKKKKDKEKKEDDEKKTEDKNEMTMMTSLYYDENILNENDKESNKINNNEKKKINKQKIELPTLEL